MEAWLPLQDYPGYSASDLGRVRNDKRQTILTPNRNQSDVTYVCLMREGNQVKRSLSRLICETFVPNTNQIVPFTTPIHLNGNPIDCKASNLLWRPRWFALKHGRQFKLDLPEYYPIRDKQTNEVFDSVWSFVLAYGLLYMDVVLSVYRFTRVFPIMHDVEWAT